MTTAGPNVRFYNTLTHRLEPFAPLHPPVVTMYNCGPTVYDFAHIGNFKTFLFADVLRRFLEMLGYDVRQVMNLTDVGHMTDDASADGAGEDKMAAAARRLAEAKKQGQAHANAIADPHDPYQVAQFYIDAFLDDARKLRLKVADEHPARTPRATQHVPQMIAMIERLIERGHAYVARDGAVYYRVRSFPDYGKLSGNTLDQLRGGAGGRVQQEHQSVKEHPADFLLWKPDPTHLMKWDSPWGAGYPGWHIECSAMATHVLGAGVIDIHTGGEDNIFPHHECEIAQTCGATGEEAFARYWLHSRHLFVEGKKMSKREGNFFTVRQVMDGAMTGRPVDAAVLRFELLKANYRTQMNLSAQGLLDAASAVRKLREFYASLSDVPPAEVPLGHPVLMRFVEALADDLNTAGALAVVFAFIAEPVSDPAEARGLMERFDSVLAVLEPDAITDGYDADARCQDLDDARKRKDYAAADAIRAELIAAGYDVKTTATGTVATRKLA